MVWKRPEAVAQQPLRSYNSGSSCRLNETISNTQNTHMPHHSPPSLASEAHVQQTHVHECTERECPTAKPSFAASTLTITDATTLTTHSPASCQHPPSSPMRAAATAPLAPAMHTQAQPQGWPQPTLRGQPVAHSCRSGLLPLTL
jgi:hypothetical protein